MQTKSKSNNNKKFINNIYKKLDKKYSGVIELKYSKPIELLIAVILSAQCTDIIVNKITEKVFKKYKNIEDYVNADMEEFKNDIKMSGFFNTKAKNIINSCKIILNEHNGIVPNKMEELIKLNGVGRKTANIILSNIYGLNEGIAVDTHMLRVNYRFGITKSKKDAKKVELELMEILPKKLWSKYTYLIIDHGRAICTARKPKCEKCFLKDTCAKNM